jgi:hypothetical protein
MNAQLPGDLHHALPIGGAHPTTDFRFDRIAVRTH